MAAVAVVSMPVAAQAQDPWVGTWRLNLAKSKYEPAGLAPKSQTIRQDAVAGGGMKTVVDAVDAQGRTTHVEYMTMFDGKPTDIKGAPDANTTRVYKRVDGRTYEYVQSVAGKLTTTARTAVSADGKTRTITTTGKDAQGRTVNNLGMYERQ
jgi:histidinol dehydrogenase